MDNKLQYWIELNHVKLFYKILTADRDHIYEKKRLKVFPPSDTQTFFSVFEEMAREKSGLLLRKNR